MLFWRGLRWRRGYAIAVLLVAAIGTAVAAVGPLYARAATESTLTDELSGAGAAAGLSFDADRSVAGPAATTGLLRDLGSAVRVPGAAAPITSRQLLVTGLPVGSHSAAAAALLVTRSGVCSQIVVVRGRCVRSRDEIVVPDAASRDSTQWQVGRRLVVREAFYSTTDGLVEENVLARPLVVGTYVPRDADATYWFNRPYFVSRLGPGARAAAGHHVDAIFASATTFAAFPPNTSGLLSVDVALQPAVIRLADVPRLRAAVAAVQRRFPTRIRAPSAPSMHTGVPGVLADAARDRRQVDTGTLVVVLELAVLAWLVLFQVVAGAVSARGDEIALAKLRGLPPRRTVAFALAEPLALMVVALPLGLLIGYGMTAALAATVLVDETPVVLTAQTWWALAGSFAGGLIAAVLASVRVLTRPVLEQWRVSVPRVARRRRLLLVDAALVVLAVVALVALDRDGGQPRARYLIAPAAVVLAAAVVGVRLLPLVAALGLRPTRGSPRLAWFLALRQTVRRPDATRLAMLLAVATGLATFAVCGEAVAADNRSARARTEIGADQVLAVQFGGGHDPETVVDRVDPDGRWAMAAAAWSPDGAGGSGGNTVNGLLLGVQPARLARVAAAVRGELSPSALAALVAPPTIPPPASFIGTRLRVRLTSQRVAGQAPGVELRYRTAQGAAGRVAAGMLRAGTAGYTAAVPCGGGCDFAGVGFEPPAGYAGAIALRVVVRAVSAARRAGFVPVNVRLAASAWRGAALGPAVQVRISDAGGRMSADLRSEENNVAGIGYADLPAVVPIVTAPKGATSPTSDGTVADYGGFTVAYRVAARAPVLPVVLDAGAIAGLDFLRLQLPGFDDEAAWSVWLGPGAPKDALARLTRAGLIVARVDTVAARTHRLGREGPALGLILLLVCAVASAVLAVGAAAVGTLASGRRRAFEFAALRMIGAPRRTIRRSAVLEQALVLSAAVLLGAPSGYLAARVTLPRVPEFSDATPVVLRYAPGLLVVLAAAATLVVLLLVTAVVTGSALVRAAVPERLREAIR